MQMEPSPTQLSWTLSPTPKPQPHLYLLILTPRQALQPCKKKPALHPSPFQAPDPISHY